MIIVVIVMNNQDVVVILSKIRNDIKVALRLNSLESMMKRLTK